MFATIALFSWPIVVIILFRVLPRPHAVLISLLGGYLLLPTQGGVDLPLLPALEKHSIPALSVLIVVLIARQRETDPPALKGWLPQGFLPRLLILIIIAGSFMTVLTNGDMLVFGPRVLPGLRLYDAFSAALLSVILMLPLLLARKFLAHPEQQRLLLLVMCIAGMLYSLLALYEVRMSPQLNRTLYGYFPHDWIQHLRNGGFRPIVFLSHGLQLATFFAGTLMAAVALMRLGKGARRTNYLLAALWLFMTLVLCKSLGALIIAVAMTPVILLFGARLQALAAAIVVILVISYPLSRGAGLIPVERIYTMAAEYSAERGISLRIRLINEERLLEKASQRPAFGWGGYGRTRLYDEFGNDTSITDGYWVIAIGGGGWTRFLAEFLLLGGPVLLLAMRRRTIGSGMETTALAVITAGWMIDLLPNSALTPPLWIMAGALWGRLELGRVTAADASGDPVAVQTRGIAYSRMPKKHRPSPNVGQNARQVGATRYTRERKT